MTDVYFKCLRNTMKSMKVKCRVHDEWLTRKDKLGYVISSWATKRNESSVFCAVCLSTFSCEMKGFQAITQHVSTKFHQNNAKCKLDST